MGWEYIPFFNGLRLSPLGTAATSGLLYKPQMIDEGDCGAIGGMKIGRGNRSTRKKKPAPAPLCPPQIPHDQTRARTRAAAVGSRRLTAWPMARPEYVPWYCGLNRSGICYIRWYEYQSVWMKCRLRMENFAIHYDMMVLHLFGGTWNN
jgi:hypothetical protein